MSMATLSTAQKRPLCRMLWGRGGGSPDGRRRLPLAGGPGRLSGGDATMGPVPWIRRLATLVLASLLVAGACGRQGSGDGGGSGRAGDALVVGSFGFSESRVLAELYAQAAEALGVRVERSMDLASREVVEPALEQGVIDVVPEYSGTALEFVNRNAGQANADPVSTHRLLSRALEPRGLVALQPAPAQNQNAFAVSRSTAERHRLTRISDLAPVASQLVLGGPPECPERRFCLPGLTNTYGLSFKRFQPLDAAGPHTVGALEGGEIDVGLLFTSSPAVAAKDLVLLADDMQLQPAESVVPVMRAAALERFGDPVRQRFDAVSAKLTTEELIGLNREVELGGRPAAAVARAWLDRHGFTPR